MAFGGIALVIALMLGSFLEAAFVVSIIPFAMAGVVLAFSSISLRLTSVDKPNS